MQNSDLNIILSFPIFSFQCPLFHLSNTFVCIDMNYLIAVKNVFQSSFLLLQPFLEIFWDVDSSAYFRLKTLNCLKFCLLFFQLTKQENYHWQKQQKHFLNLQRVKKNQSGKNQFQNRTHMHCENTGLGMYRHPKVTLAETKMKVNILHLY